MQEQKPVIIRTSPTGGYVFARMARKIISFQLCRFHCVLLYETHALKPSSFEADHSPTKVDETVTREIKWKYQTRAFQLIIRRFLFPDQKGITGLLTQWHI